MFLVLAHVPLIPKFFCAVPLIPKNVYHSSPYLFAYFAFLFIVVTDNRARHSRWARKVKKIGVPLFPIIYSGVPLFPENNLKIFPVP